MVLALFLIFPHACIAERVISEDCGSSRCGNVTITYPFRLKSQPRECGDYGLQMECDNRNRTIFFIGKTKLYVQEISYLKRTIRVVDESKCLTELHVKPFDSTQFSYSDSNITVGIYLEFSTSFLVLVNCTTPMKSSLYIDASLCTNTSSSYSYFINGNSRPSDLNESCIVTTYLPVIFENTTGLSSWDVYQKLSQGYELQWFYYTRTKKDNNFLSFGEILRNIFYGFGWYVQSIRGFFTHGRNAYGSPKGMYIVSLVTIVVVYKLRRRHLSADDRIEEFLRSQNNLMPIRYSYHEIKRMTGGFKDKLGEGGYGSVFKGKLRSNHLVAVKVLGKSKANGQDFISEVSTIGRIHHVNVAKLIGFCVEGSKQALVHDFMPNGSLDKIIFARENKSILSWQKIYDIALGVARGIEYLHQGCDSQILHFDIKPHNILLDENFIPKVSDFGLAKLYSVDDSIVSLTAARGTLGYIAPELMYKNIGGISYKADVYSFGMLLLEMVGRRKNLNESVEHSSQIYFPSWIYARLYQGEDMDLGDVTLTGIENIIVRKMAIVAFWCIQMKPADRPSMSKVLEMLETDTELLEMPPKPFQLLLAESSSSGDIENPFVEPTRSCGTVNITSLNVV
ncbi:hypothetical protein PTKIN_Ptkin14bG0100100 [Pterospermum kingtungense]